MKNIRQTHSCGGHRPLHPASSYLPAAGPAPQLWCSVALGSNPGIVSTIRLLKSVFECLRTRNTALLAIAWIATASVSVLHAQVLSDAFTNRPVAGGPSANFTGDSTAATSEFGEPNHGTTYNSGTRKHTVWGAWTAPGNGTVTIKTEGSSFDTVLAVYTGNALGSLLPVAESDDVQAGFRWSAVSFPTKAGETYSIAIDGGGGTSSYQGSVLLNVSFNASAHSGAEIGTNSFAARPTLPSGPQALGVSDTRLASDEVNEPNHGATYNSGTRKQTVWWSWVAPENGIVTIKTEGSSFDTVLAVYTGNALGSLLPVAENDDVQASFRWSAVSFPTKAGEAYSIAVDGGGGTSSYQGGVVLNVAFSASTRPGAEVGTNSFAARPTLPSWPQGLGVSNTRLASDEVNEPNHGATYNSGTRKQTVWWSWVAPENGIVTIKTEGSSFNTVLAVYTGNALGSLLPVARNNDVQSGVGWSSVSFPARAGEAYSIAVDGSGGTSTYQGNVLINLLLANVGSRDLNGDGTDELMLQYSPSSIAVWFMNGSGGIVSGKSIYSGNLGDWKAVAFPDLNQDGIPDVVFQNTAGQIVGWFLNRAAAATGTVTIYGSALGDWKVVASGDLNNDGIADLVLQNTAGQIVGWLMNGAGHYTAGVTIYGSALGDWRVRACADLNSDGTPDLIFQNTAGQIAGWLMNGAGRYTAGVTIYANGLGDWKVRAMADLNSDGIPDLVFQNNAGQIVGWLMDGNGSYTSGINIYGSALAGWRLF